MPKMEVEELVNAALVDQTCHEEDEEDERKVVSTSLSFLSPQLRAMMRIKSKYQALKRRNMTGSTGGGGPQVTMCHAPQVFTFKQLAEQQAQRRKKRKSRVLFPTASCKLLPKEKGSRAKPFLVLFSIIVFLQIYNAIENLDDNVVKYELEVLEKTLQREVFGQGRCLESLMDHLQEYLSTYVHKRPLALSIHGPSGVGKSHLGHLLVRHFRSVLGEELVLHYFTLLECPPPLQSAPAQHGSSGSDPSLGFNPVLCAAELESRIAQLASRAEESERIPLVVLDEAHFLPLALLDLLLEMVRPEQSNRPLNVIYVLLSSDGQEEITCHTLHNSSSSSTSTCTSRQVKSVEEAIRSSPAKRHALWAEVEVLALNLLERSHVVKCFLEEMIREGFYPEPHHAERLADQLTYFPTVGGKQYARSGCKQVVSKVNLL